MAASDSSQFIIIALIAAFSVVSVSWAWIYSRRARPPSNESSVRTITISSNREISERQSIWNTLSAREKEIARLAAAYWSDDEIARELHLSVRTVQNHLQHAREKLRIHSRHEFKYFLQRLEGDSKPPPTYR